MLVDCALNLGHNEPNKRGRLIEPPISQTEKVIKMTNSTEIVKKLEEMRLKLWEKYGKKRIYMTCAQFNAVTGRNYSLNDKKNKIFYDFETNAIMRTTHKNKTTIEVQL